MKIQECRINLNKFMSKEEIVKILGMEYNPKGTFAMGYYIENNSMPYVATINVKSIKNVIEGGPTRELVQFLRVDKNLSLEGAGVEIINSKEHNNVETAFLKDSQEIYPDKDRLNFFELNDNPDKFTKDQVVEAAIRAGFALTALEERYGKTLISNDDNNVAKPAKPGVKEVEALVSEHPTDKDIIWTEILDTDPRYTYTTYTDDGRQVGEISPRLSTKRPAVPDIP